LLRDCRVHYFLEMVAVVLLNTSRNSVWIMYLVE